MKHIDLFSGIGGFAYAAQKVWGDEYENICFCDNNKFCQEVIKKNFGKESLIYGDIREVTLERIIADLCAKNSQQGNVSSQRSGECTTQKENTQNTSAHSRRCDSRIMPSNGNKNITGDEKNETTSERVDILTGGFPCQPFSQAGKRGGTGDDRYLWPEMLRVIQDTHPWWIIAENVRGILTIESGLVFEQVCLDLERAGYAVQSFIIPAVAANAPHRRDRIWIIAHNTSIIGYRKKDKIQTGRHGTELSSRNASNTHGSGRGASPGRVDENKSPENERRGKQSFIKRGGQNSNAPDTRGKRLQGRKRTGTHEERSTAHGPATKRNYSWNQNWFKVAAELCRVDDGLPAELDGFKFNKAGHRVERLKALGNAIVPQVAMEIMRAIKENDRN